MPSYSTHERVRLIMQYLANVPPNRINSIQNIAMHLNISPHSISRTMLTDYRECFEPDVFRGGYKLPLDVVWPKGEVFDLHTNLPSMIYEATGMRSPSVLSNVTSIDRGKKKDPYIPKYLKEGLKLLRQYMGDDFATMTGLNKIQRTRKPSDWVKFYNMRNALDLIIEIEMAEDQEKVFKELVNLSRSSDEDTELIKEFVRLLMNVRQEAAKEQ